MSLGDLGLLDYESNTLLLDGDILIYLPCCVFNSDDDASRRQIQKNIKDKLNSLMIASECDKYIMFVTTKFNFRNFLIDNYKGNRIDVERPVNLAWAKRWAVECLQSHFHKYLEADDLLGIYANDKTVIWSIDKDLRQISGLHLDDKTMKLIEVTPDGVLREVTHKTESGKTTSKVYFDGLLGFYFQMLTGDSTDNILGCATREKGFYKSGAKKGQENIKRKGVGPKAALKILTEAYKAKGCISDALKAVVCEYKKVHGKDWQYHLEVQANLLYMVREQEGDVIKCWTVDGRDRYFNITTGKHVNGFIKTTN